MRERTLEDRERHLLVKVIDRILYKLDDLVRPYVHMTLVVIEPLLSVHTWTEQVILPFFAVLGEQSLIDGRSRD